MSLEDMSELSTREEELQRRLNIMKEKLIEVMKKTEKLKKWNKLKCQQG